MTETAVTGFTDNRILITAATNGIGLAGLPARTYDLMT
jgi:hypothetical protein